MAGSIFISKELRLPLSTRQFDYFAKYIREAFLSDEQQVREEVFRPFEEEGIDFLSAETLSVEHFSKFCAVVNRAEQRARSEETFPNYEQIWQELHKRIEADMRFQR